MIRMRISDLLYILLPHTLHFHHIDTNRKNNNLNNLIILPARTHRLVHKHLKNNVSLRERKGLKSFLQEHHYIKTFLLQTTPKEWVDFESKRRTKKEEFIVNNKIQ